MKIKRVIKGVVLPVGVAGALTLALVVGGGVPALLGDRAIAGLNPPPTMSSVFIDSEMGDISEAPELLSDEEVAALSEEEVEQILEESSEEVAEAQSQFAAEASAADYAMAVAAYEAIRTELEQAIEQEGIEGAIEELSTTTHPAPPTIVNASLSKACMTVYKWQLQTIAWVFIGFGAFYSIAGLFVAVTGVGLPVGAIIGALGIGISVTAQFFLWKVDQQRWNSKRVCF